MIVYIMCFIMGLVSFLDADPVQCIMTYVNIP